MAASITQLTTLVELWQRRHEPESHDLLRALRVAEELERDPATPQVLLALAQRLVLDVHEAAGWSVPGNLFLPRCTSASASLRQTYTLAADHVLREVRNVREPVILMGLLGASQSAFGCWDALPTQGEVLVRVGDRRADSYENIPLNQHGVRWAGAGEHGRLLDLHTRSVALGDRKVLVPNPELLVARAHGLPSNPNDVNCLVFCAAAYAAATAGHWDQALELAGELGHGRAPIEIAMRFGITDWLGLSVGPITRLSVTLRGLVKPHRSAALF